MGRFLPRPIHVCDAEVSLACFVPSVHMAIYVGIGDGTRIFEIPSLSITPCIYVDRGHGQSREKLHVVVNTSQDESRCEKTCKHRQHLPQGILRSRKCSACKDVLPDFAKYCLLLPHVSYRRISPSKTHCPNMDSHPATLSTVYCDCNIWRREGWIEYEVFSFWKREINQFGLREA
jgi:hypothetical protein